MRQFAKALACTALASMVGGAGLAAQAPEKAPRTWVNQLYPYAYYSSVDGFWLAGHVSWYSPMGFTERPEPSFANIRLDAAASTKGSYLVVADAQAPAYWDGWRAALTLTAARANRLGYYGQGNDAPYDRDSITPANPYFYRVSRTSQTARLTVQRRVIGPLRVLAGATVEHTDFRALPGQSRFRQDLASGAVDSATVPFTDYVVRGGLVVDRRDQEVDPHRGVFAEALVANGRGYTRTTAQARVYLHPLEKLILAGRVGIERMTGSPPAAAQLSMESSDGPFIAVGGYRSLRGYYDARFVGPGKLVGGVEARYGLLWAPRLMELKLVAFYDVGRVFGPGERTRLTTDGLHSAAGGEVALALFRNTLFVLGFGKSGEGTQLLFGTTWSY
jgi:outer membrane protein assembly factor BamA